MEPHPVTTAHAARRRHRRRGIAIVEVVVALSVLVVAASIFCQMLISTGRLRQMNRENALAADAARVVIEQMRNRPFLEIYRAYNEDATDDPGGQGTAPGHLFHVPGLTPLEDATQGMAGRIVMPSTQVQVTTSSSSGGGKMAFGTGTVTVTQQWHLREDYVDAKLGMPRDVNGNNVVDTANHSSDYLLLPVRVVIQWKSATGPRRVEVLTQLGDFVLEEGS